MLKKNYPVPRTSTIPTKQELELKPIIFTTACDGWGAKSWTLQHLKEHYGHSEVAIQKNEKIAGISSRNSMVVYKKERKTLSDYIDAVINGNSTSGYLAQFPIENLPASIQKDFSFPRLYHSNLLSQTKLWIGPSGTKSKLHYDIDHNFFAQILGRKEVALIAPEYSDYCYPVAQSWYDVFSPVDVYRPNYDLYPKFKDVPIYHTILEPGEMLFIPQGWWHDVRALDVSISLNFWWITPSMLLNQLWQECRFRATHPLHSWEGTHSYPRAIIRKLRSYVSP